MNIYIFILPPILSYSNLGYLHDHLKYLWIYVPYKIKDKPFGIASVLLDYCECDTTNHALIPRINESYDSLRNLYVEASL